MKKKTNKNNIKGYIEGYYGKLLSWKDREQIVKSLKKHNMNTYLYAPKEDINHRLCWQIPYSTKWRSNFRNFARICKINNINLIAGIAPGLNFNFNELNTKSINKKLDFKLLLNKSKQLLNDGATSIALLLDDIPSDFKNKFGDKISEGTCHGMLANKLSHKLDQNIFFVPRIYADELIIDAPSYLGDLSKILDPEIIVFYCGANTVSKSLVNYKRIKKKLQNRIIFWDNFYSNDYCPRRFFIGPFLGRLNVNNIMINPTGLIKTDLLIIDIFASNFTGKTYIKKWEKILHTHGVPKEFLKIKKFFLKPDFGFSPSIQSLKINKQDIEILDFLLWKWKGKLSREWYPFLFGLKHDLQINQKILTSERVIKTQTIPLSDFLKKGDL